MMKRESVCVSLCVVMQKVAWIRQASGVWLEFCPGILLASFFCTDGSDHNRSYDRITVAFFCFYYCYFYYCYFCYFFYCYFFFLLLLLQFPLLPDGEGGEKHNLFYCLLFRIFSVVCVLFGFVGCGFVGCGFSSLVYSFSGGELEWMDGWE